MGSIDDIHDWLLWYAGCPRLRRGRLQNLFSLAAHHDFVLLQTYSVLNNMASITFGSIGDLVATCQVIVNIVNALSASRGSAIEYQELITELWSLAQALESVKSLLEHDPQLPHRGRLGIALQNCRSCLERELNNIQKFSASLSRKANRTTSARDAFWKTRWLGHKVRCHYSCYVLPHSPKRLEFDCTSTLF